jgi:hypothetical protein
MKIYKGSGRPKSPENLWEELETLDVVLELEMKLALR